MFCFAFLLYCTFSLLFKFPLLVLQTLPVVYCCCFCFAVAVAQYDGTVLPPTLLAGFLVYSDQ